MLSTGYFLFLFFFVLLGYCLARLERFERPTHGFEARCSIQLSYRRTVKGRTSYQDRFPLGKQKKCGPLGGTVHGKACPGRFCPGQRSKGRCIPLFRRRAAG